MDRLAFLSTTAEAGLLVTVAPPADEEQDEYAEFFSLPIYRAYVRGLQHRELPEGYIDDLYAPEELDLVREPDNRHDRKATAVYHNGHKLGYLPREDNLLLGKLVRRGLPVECRLIGVQPDEDSQRQLAIEVALLYPPHASTDPSISQSENDRVKGLQHVKNKPSHKLYESGDPLSMLHVWDGYFD
ncbi:MAG: HIRAN domain-containing protein [Saprospiraceae bacterium]